eukprot:397449_1
MSPSYLVSKDEDIDQLFQSWKEQNDILRLNDGMEYNLDNVFIAEATFQLLKLYFQNINGENVQEMNIDTILEQFGHLEQLSDVHNWFGALPQEIKHHSLFQQLKQMLTPVRSL